MVPGCSRYVSRGYFRGNDALIVGTRDHRETNRKLQWQRLTDTSQNTEYFEPVVHA